jgi:hypothetical protein
MSALTLSGIIFVLTLGGIFLGTLLRRTLPEHHLNEHAGDVVRLGVGLIATIAALVLGLLIAAAKGSFDTQTSQVRQITANLILLDNVLAQYGPEARPIREQIRSTVDPFADESRGGSDGLSAGEAVAATTGRADDFRWPRGVVNVEQAAVEAAAPDTAAPDAGAKSAKPAQRKSAMDAYAAQTGREQMPRRKSRR